MGCKSAFSNTVHSCSWRGLDASIDTAWALTLNIKSMSSRNGLSKSPGERAVVVRAAFLLCHDHVSQFAGTRQRSLMGDEDAFAAALHGFGYSEGSKQKARARGPGFLRGEVWR